MKRAYAKAGEIPVGSNEDLQDQLVKYGVNPGPIVGKVIKLQISFL